MLDADLQNAFVDTLRAGRYNLLLGAGVSLDSANRSGTRMRGVAELTRRLCDVVGVSPNTHLQRVASLLTPEQQESELVKPYTCGTVGPSLSHVPHYLWRRIFTFNVDDVLECAYERTPSRKQQEASVNHTAPFEPTPERSSVQIIHLHGSVRDPDAGFIFSLLDYAQVIQDADPWVSLLAGILPTEPFIISGTSLNEVDVQAFLRPRVHPTPGRTRGPSLLIEPYPDKITREDCRRLNLDLVEATMGDFMEWVHSVLPAPPTIAELVIPDKTNIFSGTVGEAAKLRFFSDFRLIRGGATSPAPSPSSFLYGREPSWLDIEAHADVERRSNLDVIRAVEGAPTTGSTRFVCLTDYEAIGGSGKTTTLKRVGHDLATAGEIVFYRSGELRAGTLEAAECLTACRKRPIILYDNVADYAEEVIALIEAMKSPLCILGAERSYRERHLDNVVGSRTRQLVKVGYPSRGEYRNLIERYARFGLIATEEFARRPEVAVRKIEHDPIAFAVCRILNDFRPVQQISASLWDAAPKHQRLPFLAVALAHRCHNTGLRLSLLGKLTGNNELTEGLFDDSTPLAVDLHPELEDFVVPSSSIIADSILQHVSKNERSILSDGFRALAMVLAPFVNRQTIVRRTPEALIARRLFNADDVVQPLLGDQAERFYNEVQEQWRWNSRYWEQRALLIAGDDLDTAIRHARHGVAIERHAYPLTTLGKLLLKRSAQELGRREQDFEEAMKALIQAISSEQSNSRIAVHPYISLLTGATRYLDSGGTLSGRQRADLERYTSDARYRFRRDAGVQTAAQQLERHLEAI